MEQNLIDIFSELRMDENYEDNDELNDKITSLELDNTSDEKKRDELVATELDNGYNSLFYSIFFLLHENPQHSSLARLINIAESIEETYPDLRRTLFTKKDSEDKTLLMLLIEVERDNSESTDEPEPIHLDNIRFLLQKYRELGDIQEINDAIEEAQEFCEREGIDIVLNTLGGKKRVIRKSRKKRRKRRYTYKNK